MKSSAEVSKAAVPMLRLRIRVVVVMMLGLVLGLVFRVVPGLFFGLVLVFAFGLMLVKLRFREVPDPSADVVMVGPMEGKMKRGNPDRAYKVDESAKKALQSACWRSNPHHCVRIRVPRVERTTFLRFQGVPGFKVP